MRYARLVLFILLFSSLGSAQEVNLSGTVSAAGGGPIEGATVRLIGRGTSALTDPGGFYRLTEVVDIASGVSRESVFRDMPAMRDGALFFGIADDATAVLIEAYTVNGRRASVIFEDRLSAGRYRLGFALDEMGSQLFLLRVRRGGVSTVIKAPLLGNRGTDGHGLHRLGGYEADRYMEKSLQAVDTLVANAPQYIVGRQAVTSLTGTYDFQLLPAAFTLTSPADSAMITASRAVPLSWSAMNGAVGYEVWLNITRNDYDWYSPVPLLERYTKIGEVTGTGFTTDDLSDRWTYKWYVIAIDNAGNRTQSEVRLFGVYLPQVEQVDDGVNLIEGCRDLNKNGSLEPFENWRLRPEARVQDLVSRMSVEQKANQLFYDKGGWTYFWPIGVDQIHNDFVSISGTSPFGIPYITAGDQIDGYRIAWPSQPGLAAIRDANWAYKCADLQRRCHRAISAYGTLAPLAEIGTTVLYPRIQEGCGEDADEGAAQVRALIAGYHNGPELNPSSMLETLKHWAGQGAGGEGSVVYDWTTIKYHMKPWHAAIQAGVANIMPGYARVPLLETVGGRIAYLRDSLHYNGISTTDWLPPDLVPEECNLGNDVMGGVGPSYAGSMISGCSQDRITEACTRVINAKIRLGMFENPYPPHRTDADAYWQSLREEGIHVEAARKCITLLKNDGILPLNGLPSGSSIAVAGALAESDVATYVWYSGWNEGSKTFAWWIQQEGEQRGYNVSVGTGGTPGAAICIVGERCGIHYTHGTDWPTEQVSLPDDQMNVLRGFKDAGVPVIVVFIMPRPYLITWSHDNASAIIAAYRPGDGGPQALAEFLFGEFEPQGVLPWQLPRSFDQIINDQKDIPYDMGATQQERDEIRARIGNGERVEPVYGDPLYQCGFGLKSW